MKSLRLLLLSLIFINIPLVSFAVYPQPVKGSNAMVVSNHHLAAKIGIDILKQGGNAIDAAVAIGYVLAVVYPDAGNLGGGGFMLLRLANGKEVFLNFRETAPAAATKDMYLDSKGKIIPGLSTKGYLAVAVPGTVMGLNTAREKYGSMPLKQLMAPAIKMAEEGFTLTEADLRSQSYIAENLADQANVSKIFLKNGQPYAIGAKLLQPELAQTLKEIAQGGTGAFYQGKIANEIAKAAKANGGIITTSDLHNYKIEELKPVSCDYRGYHIISAPPPSSGGVTLCEMLNIIEAYPLNYLGWHSAASAHYMIEAMRLAYYDRNRYLGDPNFVDNTVEHLISKDYAAELRQRIPRYTAGEEPSTIISTEGTNTTHFSVIDKQGNAVAVTYTLNNHFGAGVIAGNTGFFLNDEMDDFTASINEPNFFGLMQGEKNSIAPGKRPLSSMTPTIVTHNNQPVLILGAPGGARIITAIEQVISNVIDYEMDIKSAVDSPRFHFQGTPNIVYADSYAFSQDTLEKLVQMNYKLEPPQGHMGFVEAIAIDPSTHTYYGASDDRQPLGAAIGY